LVSRLLRFWLLFFLFFSICSFVLSLSGDWSNEPDVSRALLEDVFILLASLLTAAAAKLLFGSTGDLESESESESELESDVDSDVVEWLSAFRFFDSWSSFIFSDSCSNLI
jgi:hypothetical protein